MLFRDITARDPVLSRGQKFGLMELLRSGCSSTCGRADGAVVLVSAYLVTTEPLARLFPDDILTILTRQMATFGGPLVLAGAGPGTAGAFTEFSQGAVTVADASSAILPWPSGKPNPFDPGTIVRGAVLPIIGDIREPAPQARQAASQAMADALDAPARNYTFAELFGPFVDLFSDDDAPDEETMAVTFAKPQKPAPEPAAIASVIPEEEITPPPAEIARTPSPAAPWKSDVIVTAAAPARQLEPAVLEGAPAPRTDSPAFWGLPTERLETAELQSAPEIVLAAVEDDPEPPREVVNYTFTELFGTLADYFSGDGGVMADASEVAPAFEADLASIQEETPEVSADTVETTLAAATPPQAPPISSESPVETLPPPAQAVEVILRDDNETQDSGSGDLFAWIADAFTEAPAPPPGEMHEVAVAAPEATLAPPAPVASEPAPGLPDSPPVVSETPPTEVAGVRSRDEDEPQGEPQDISGLFAWISDAFSSAPGTAADEAGQAAETPTPARTEPDLALAALPDSKVSAGSSTTLSKWKGLDREMPTALAELLGAPELARAVENMRARELRKKGAIERPGDPSAEDSVRPSDDGWAVKNVEIARIPPPLPRKPRPVKPKKHYLSGVVLKPVGKMSLGKPFRKRNPCIEKKRGSVVFCLEPVQWPRAIDPYFRIDSMLYQGARAIVRYDEGIASTFHILFDSSAFDSLVSHYAARYGAPTEKLNRSIAPLAAPRQPNPIAMWRSVDPVTSLVSTLEIRKYDDSRGGFPDTKRGAIMLYHTWSEPIFPLLSTAELMLLDPS